MWDQEDDSKEDVGVAMCALPVNSQRQLGLAPVWRLVPVSLNFGAVLSGG